MCNISMERQICRPHDGIKTIRLHLINHNTFLSDPWLRTLEQKSFQARWKLSTNKTVNNSLLFVFCVYLSHCLVVSCSLVVTYWERAGILALLYVTFSCVLSTHHIWCPGPWS